MAARIGIELGPVGCRIVDLVTDAPPSPTDGLTRVRSFGAYVRPGRDLRDALKALRGRSAAVVAWGLAADHAQAIVPCTSYERMRTAALTQRRREVAEGRRVADIAPAAPAHVHATTRPVVLVSAPSALVAAAVQPLAAAGIRVRSVTTPAAALMSLARRGAPGTDPTGIYVALAETTTAIALVRNGALVSAEETAWGYLDPDRGLLLRRKGEVAAYVASRLEACFTAARPRGEIAKVYLCGGMPDLRTVALSLIECLDVEVDACDSLFGIDTDRLPEEGLDLRERPANLRLAWIAAVESPAPLDLLYEWRQRRQRAWLSRAAMFAGMAAGLGLGYLVEPAVRPIPVLAFTPRAAAGGRSHRRRRQRAPEPLPARTWSDPSSRQPTRYSSLAWRRAPGSGDRPRRPPQARSRSRYRQSWAGRTRNSP